MIRAELISFTVRIHLRVRWFHRTSSFYCFESLLYLVVDFYFKNSLELLKDILEIIMRQVLCEFTRFLEIHNHVNCFHFDFQRCRCIVYLLLLLFGKSVSLGIRVAHVLRAAWTDFCLFSHIDF